MRHLAILRLAIACGMMAFSVGVAEAAMITASDDTILLQNGTPSFADQRDAEDNFGGRTELIVGPNSGQPRIGLLRFDVSSLATEINNGTPVESASLTLYERSGRNGNNGTMSTEFGAFLVTSSNSGWVEGTNSGSSGGFSGQPGSVSKLYLSTPTAAGAGDGTQWASGGGGADPVGDIPPSDGFTIGTDTGASIGSSTFVGDTNDANQVWTITLDAAALEAVLADWLADPTGNGGLALDRLSGDSGQWFFGSVESGVDDPGAVLNLTFVPEPSSVLMVCMAVAGLGAVRMRSRLG